MFTHCLVALRKCLACFLINYLSLSHIRLSFVFQFYRVPSLYFSGDLIFGPCSELSLMWYATSTKGYSSFGCKQPQMSLVTCATILAAIRRQLHISTPTGQFRLWTTRNCLCILVYEDTVRIITNINFKKFFHYIFQWHMWFWSSFWKHYRITRLYDTLDYMLCFLPKQCILPVLVCYFTTHPTIVTFDSKTGELQMSSHSARMYLHIMGLQMHIFTWRGIYGIS